MGENAVLPSHEQAKPSLFPGKCQYNSLGPDKTRSVAECTRKHIASQTPPAGIQAGINVTHKKILEAPV